MSEEIKLTLINALRIAKSEAVNDVFEILNERIDPSCCPEEINALRASINYYVDKIYAYGLAKEYLEGSEDGQGN